jgi:hypothetical protein
MKTFSSFVAVCVCLVFSTADLVVADLLEWPIVINESQVKNGPEADGSTDSMATGSGVARYDTDTNTFFYNISWTGLEGLLTKIHIHGPADPSMSNPTHLVELIEFDPMDNNAGATPTLPASPGVSFNYTGNRTTGSVSNTHQLAASHVAGDETDIISIASIVDTMFNGLSYVNVHSQAFPMGEIRGNLPPIPEPASAAILSIGGLALLARRRRA